MRITGLSSDTVPQVRGGPQVEGGTYAGAVAVRLPPLGVRAAIVFAVTFQLGANDSARLRMTVDLPEPLCPSWVLFGSG